MHYELTNRPAWWVQAAHVRRQHEEQIDSTVMCAIAEGRCVSHVRAVDHFEKLDDPVRRLEHHVILSDGETFAIVRTSYRFLTG